MRPKAHPESVYEFGEFRLEAGKRMLYRNGEEVAMVPKAVETLLALVERQGEIVSKDELMEAVWADTIVEESNLARYIHLLRTTLGAQEDGAAYIDTYRRRGYRFNGQAVVSVRTARNVAIGMASAAARDLYEIRREATAGRVVSISDWPRPSVSGITRALRHNLPAPISSFLGRDAELTELKELLQNEDLRLLTLTGPGGTGKTRLSIALGAEVLGDFADGVFFVELSAVRDAELLGSTIVSVLKVEHTGAFPVFEDLKTYLRTREILLILDNLEQVITVGPQIVELLEACPALKVVTTSREPLRVRGEQEYLVAPLELPATDPWVSPVDRLPTSAAVRLFVERAQLVNPHFRLDGSNAPEVADICRRLDGLPLAIELAAVRTRVLSPAKIAERLENGLNLLTGGLRDLPDRQRTMRSAIAWSYDLLDHNEQTLFRQLAVFVGGFTLEAASSVCEPQSGSDILDQLSSLVDKNLLRQKEGINGAPRFYFLETIREFAIELLEESGEADPVRDRHVSFFSAFAKRSERELVGSQQPLVLNCLDAEDDNFRAALAWLRQTGNVDLELKLASSLSPCWLLKGHIAEGVDRLKDILGRAPSADSPSRAKALTSLGQLLWMVGDYEATIDVCEEGLGIANRLGVEAVAARCLFYAASSKLYRYDDAETAAAYLEESLRRSRAIGFDMGVVFSLTGLADVYKRTDLARANDLLEEAVAIAQSTQNHVCLSVALSNSALVAIELGNYDVAEQRAKEGLIFRAELADWCGMLSCTEPLAAVAVATGQPERAVVLLAAMDPIIEASGVVSPGVLKSGHEQNCEAARLALGEAEFYNLWREGRRMSPEQVIEFALASPRFEVKV